RPRQPGDQQQRCHGQGDGPVGDCGRDSEPSFVHRCTVAGSGGGRVRPVDERTATTSAVPARPLPPARYPGAATAAEGRVRACRTTGRTAGAHALEGSTQARKSTGAGAARTGCRGREAEEKQKRRGRGAT